MSGLFDALPKPEERQKAVLMKALETRRDRWPHPGFVYQGGGDLLLQHGQFYSGRILPDQYAHHKGQVGQCFMNALTAAQEDSTLRYVEGVYTIGHGHYTPHAWCIDPAGELLEVTLPMEHIDVGIEASSGLPILPPEHWGYWGAVFHPEYVQAVFDAQDGSVGLLDRPAHDATDPLTFGRVGEWRDDWHVLRVPYDANRKSI